MFDISVIIPVHNEEATLTDSINSVLDQKGVLVEVIVIDDASTDTSAELAANIAAGDSRVRIIRRNQRGGPGTARNDGMAHVGSSMVTFLDSDDIFIPGALEAMARTMIEKKADIVYGCHSWLDGTGRIRPVSYLERYLESVVPIRDNPDMAALFGVVAGKLFKKEIATGPGIEFPPLSCYEDMVFSLYTWYEAKTIASSTLPVLIRRPHPRLKSNESASERRSLESTGDFITAITLVNDYCIAHDLEDVLRNFMPVSTSRLLLHISQIIDPSIRNMAYDKFRSTLPRFQIDGACFEEESGLSLSEAVSLDFPKVTESYIRYRAVRKGLEREMEKLQKKNSD